MRRFTVVMVLVGSLVAFLLLHLYTLSQGPGWDPVSDHASFRTNAWGLKAFRELLEGSGVKCKSWQQPWSRLSPRVGLLLVADPQSAPSASEAEALAKWVAAGGRAVILPDPRTEDRGITPPDRREANLRLLAYFGWTAANTAKPDTEARARSLDPLLRDVHRLAVPAEWRLKPLAAGQTLPESPGPPKRRGPKPEAPRPVITERGVAFAEDAAGIIGLRIAHGRGEVVLLCDADMLANRCVSKADNVILGADIAFSGRGGEVWFDEYHHGLRGSSDEGLDATAPARAIWAALAALALFYAGKFVRFGAPVPADPPPRRSSLEYVRAFASLYRRGRQRKAALGMIVGRFRARLASVAGMPGGASAEVLARAVGQRRPWVEEARLAALLRRCEEKLSDATTVTDAASVSDADLLDLSRAISRIEQEITRHDH